MNMKKMMATIGCLLLLCATAARGDGVVRLDPPFPTVLTDRVFSIDLVIDVGPAGVGSYGAVVTWDPSVLAFDDWIGGDPPFGVPEVNDDDTENGTLRVADAATGHAGGAARVLTLTFRTMTPPMQTSDVDLEMTSLFDGVALENVLPDVTVTGADACIADWHYDLRVEGKVATLLNWIPTSGAQTFDVIRGDLSPALDAVVCVENDSADTTTGSGTEPANPDRTIPPPGAGFFYLVRMHTGVEAVNWGFVAHCSTERIVGPGGCP